MTSNHLSAIDHIPEGLQYVLPGAEKSARQAAAAREDRGHGRIVTGCLCGGSRNHQGKYRVHLMDRESRWSECRSQMLVRRNAMRRGPFLLALFPFMLLGSGCNTIAGFGQDVSAAGNVVTGGAEKIQGSGSSAQTQPTPQRMAAQGNVYFPTGGVEIAPGAQNTISRVVTFLKTNPDQRVRVEGFTDSTGTQATNEALSQRRAEAVRDTLVAGGIDADRIETHGNGDASPVASNSTAEGRQMNRRAVVTVSNLPQGQSGSSGPPPTSSRN
jgi:outer membrane protein OmpA-like peptidoglycan-associated protein